MENRKQIDDGSWRMGQEVMENSKGTNYIWVGLK